MGKKLSPVQILDLLKKSPELLEYYDEDLLTGLLFSDDASVAIQAYEQLESLRPQLADHVLTAPMSLEQMDHLFQTYPELRPGLAVALVRHMRNELKNVQAEEVAANQDYEASALQAEDATRILREQRALLEKIQAELPSMETLAKTASANKGKAKRLLTARQKNTAAVKERYEQIAAQFPDAVAKLDQIEQEAAEFEDWMRPVEEPVPAGAPALDSAQADQSLDEFFQQAEASNPAPRGATQPTRVVVQPITRWQKFWRGVGYFGAWLWYTVLVPLGKFLWFKALRPAWNNGIKPASKRVWHWLATSAPEKTVPVIEDESSAS